MSVIYIRCCNLSHKNNTVLLVLFTWKYWKLKTKKRGILQQQLELEFQSHTIRTSSCDFTWQAKGENDWSLLWQSVYNWAQMIEWICCESALKRKWQQIRAGWKLPSSLMAGLSPNHDSSFMPMSIFIRHKWPCGWAKGKSFLLAVKWNRTEAWWCLSKSTHNLFDPT